LALPISGYKGQSSIDDISAVSGAPDYLCGFTDFIVPYKKNFVNIFFAKNFSVPIDKREQVWYNEISRKKERALERPLAYTQAVRPNSSQLKESTGEKIDHSLPWAVYFFLLFFSVTKIEMIVTTIETIFKQIVASSHIDLPPLGFQPLEFSLCPPPRVLFILYHIQKILSTFFCKQI
jgi:hypothetical protein